jgi:hypothetical protein
MEFFTRRKSEMVNVVTEFIKKMKINCPDSCKFIRMDNAKENVALGINTRVEFTSPNTPQQNGQVERSFSTLWGRVRSMLNDSGVTEELRQKLWAECAQTATKLCNITSRRNIGSPYNLFYGKSSKMEKNLRIFGEVGIKTARNQVNMVDKLQNKGSYCLFVGYEDNHPHDAYRVLDLKNLTIMITRDVRWLGKSYGSHFGNDENKLLEFTDLEDEDEDVVILHKPNETTKEEPRVIITRSKALMDNVEEESSDSEGEEGVYMTLENEFSEPSTFKEAYFDPIIERRAAWREAINKELTDMEKCNVSELVEKEKLPKGCKPIGCKWVFKEKRDGFFAPEWLRLGTHKLQELTSPEILYLL